MSFTVNWRTSPEQGLAAVWDAAEDRAAVTAAADRIDRRLTLDPLSFGESRNSDVRLAYHGPLAVYFRVDVHQRIVSVLAVGASRRSH